MSSLSPATASSTPSSSVIFSARRTESHDIPNIVQHMKYNTERLFGRINVIYLLEKANLAVTLVNQKNATVAHAVFLDYPNWDVVDQANWEQYLEQNYVQNKCTVRNIFPFKMLMIKVLHIVCGHLQIMNHFQNILLSSGIDLATAFSPVESIAGSTWDSDCNLYVSHRHQYCPQLHLICRVEDHDDLTPIFARHNDTLRKTYGDYFLAELIEAQDEENRAVVCEDDGVAVGFMSVCSEVSIQLLHDCFDLGPFHGLCKPHPDDILKPPRKPSDIGKNATLYSKEKEQRTIQEGGLARVSSERPETSSLEISRSKDLKISKTPSILTVETEPFRPTYKGEVNAFCIQLFCIDEKHETRQFLWPSVVYYFFQDKDFCIISVPHMVPEFYLIQNFVRVIPFSSCTLDQELYVFHRSGLLKSFIVRPARTSDVAGVELLIQTLKLNKSILDDLNGYILARRDPDGTPIQAFVAEVLHQIVGISVIRNETDIEYIRSHYNIEDFIYFSHHQQEEHGHLYHFALNPIFHHYAKHFMKEMLRLAYKSCLYYPIYPQPEDGKFQNPCAHSLTSALHYMVPVRPRRQIVYPLEKLGINAPAKEVSKDQVKYALNHFNRKLSLEPKVSVNARIVVVGASNVGISFLETLTFCPHLKFNNLTLISTHGLPGKAESNCLHNRFLSNSHCFNENDYALMSLSSWINVVVGKMTGIDRAAKHVLVSNGRKVPYDHLILCAGQQYQAPCPTGADIKKLFTNREVSTNYRQRYTGVVPSNLFAISDDEDALIAMKYLKEKVVNASGNVIVYGNTIDIYTTIAALLSLGINGSLIHLVHPPLCSNVTSLNNNAIENAVQRALSRAGVTLYHDSLLAQWNDGSHPDPIEFASFTTNTKPFRLQCSAFFNFTEKRVDYETFKAINDACLVYDGRLVIDTNFHTNDIAIRAAGSLTKFSNIYYANEWTHSNFSSKEVGFQLAATMLNLFDPTLEPVFEPPEDLDRLIPIYKGCKVQGGVLPGKYNYVHIFKPGIPSRLDVQESQPNYGMAITTGDAIKGNYFRIHVNQYSMIETITCFSKDPVPVSNYICLFAQHERLLNNLCSRWREGLITDLYSYLKEPWALTIYHDRFIDLKKELRQILVSVQEEGVPSLQELVRQVVDGELALMERPKTYLKRFYKQSVHKELLEKSILNYLDYNNYHLPMFAWPGIV
uniref:L-amino-acid oxidase n=1 Tax=Podarcis muralis TaxID=64176 RepID=A0A670K1V8_PODMU